MIVDHDICVEQPGFCLNGATCEQSWTSVRCQCAAHFQGDRCEECPFRFQADGCAQCAQNYYGDNCGNAVKHYMVNFRRTKFLDF